MNAKTFLKLATAMLACCVVSLASAKLPAPPPVDPVKAEEAKQKAAEAAKKEAELSARRRTAWPSATRSSKKVWPARKK